MSFLRVSLPRAGVIALFLLAITPSAEAIEVKSVTSPNGIEAWLVEDHKIPVIALEWGFDGAGAPDPEGKQGLANLAARTMDEGAGTLDARSFQARLLNQGITLRFDTNADTFRGSLRTLRDYRDDAFELTRLSLNEPRFDQEAIDRMRAAIVTSLKRALTDPEQIAQRTFAETAFPHSVYGKPTRGTIDSIAHITAGDLHAFAGKRLGRDRLTVAAAGDITPEELGKALDHIFGGLPAKAQVQLPPETKPAGAGQSVLAPRPIGQSVILMGSEGVKRDDPDWYAAVVMNYILGGGSFSSRLMNEVREKRGLTYGVGSALLPMNHAALIMAMSSSANATAGKAIDIIRQEWARMADSGVTDEELADAKTFLNGSFPLSFTSTSSIASVLLQIKHDKLGIDYLDRRATLINAVSKDDVARVAKRLLDPQRLLTVVVGQPVGYVPTETIEAPAP